MAALPKCFRRRATVPFCKKLLEIVRDGQSAHGRSQICMPSTSTATPSGREA